MNRPRTLEAAEGRTHRSGHSVTPRPIHRWDRLPTAGAIPMTRSRWRGSGQSAQTTLGSQATPSPTGPSLDETCRWRERSSSGALRKDSNTTRHGPRRRRHPNRVHPVDPNSSPGPARREEGQLAGWAQADALRGEGASGPERLPAGSDLGESAGRACPVACRDEAPNRFPPNLAMR